MLTSNITKKKTLNKLKYTTTTLYPTKTNKAIHAYSVQNQEP